MNKIQKALFFTVIFGFVAFVIYLERDKIHITHDKLIPEKECDYYDFYVRSMVNQKNLAVEILLSKGCLPTFVQGGHYRGSIGDSPRSYFTYISRKKIMRELDHISDRGRRTVWDGDWEYKVRDWNIKDGEVYTFMDDEVGRIVPCDGFENPMVD